MPYTLFTVMILIIMRKYLTKYGGIYSSRICICDFYWVSIFQPTLESNGRGFNQCNIKIESHQNHEPEKRPREYVSQHKNDDRLSTRIKLWTPPTGRIPVQTMPIKKYFLDHALQLLWQSSNWQIILARNVRAKVQAMYQDLREELKCSHISYG